MVLCWVIFVKIFYNSLLIWCTKYVEFLLSSPIINQIKFHVNLSGFDMFWFTYKILFFFWVICFCWSCRLWVSHFLQHFSDAHNFFLSIYEECPKFCFRCWGQHIFDYFIFYIYGNGAGPVLTRTLTRPDWPPDFFAQKNLRIFSRVERIFLTRAIAYKLFGTNFSLSSRRRQNRHSLLSVTTSNILT